MTDALDLPGDGASVVFDGERRRFAVDDGRPFHLWITMANFFETRRKAGRDVQRGRAVRARVGCWSPFQRDFRPPPPERPGSFERVHGDDDRRWVFESVRTNYSKRVANRIGNSVRKFVRRGQ